MCLNHHLTAYSPFLRCYRGCTPSWILATLCCEFVSFPDPKLTLQLQTLAFLCKFDHFKFSWVTLEKDGTLPTLAVEHCPAPLPPHPNSVGDDLRATHVTQTLSHLKHSFLSIHTMPVAAGSLTYVEHYGPRVYESKSICCLNPSQRPLFLVTNEALNPPSNNKTVKSGKAFWMKAERRTKK